MTSAAPRDARLVLVVPQLLSPLSAADWDRELEPKAPALRRLLARGRQTAVDADGFESTLFGLFGLSPSDERSLPAARFTYHFETGNEATSAAVARAEPVHLEAGIDELIMTPPEELALDVTEAQALASSVSVHFEDRGWRVEPVSPDRWYLHLPESMPLGTLPPTRVMGGNLRLNLPTGVHARYWLGVLNEIQMLLHDHPVNRAREAAGRRPVNGLWLWGDGEVGTRAPSSWSHVWADDVLARALAEVTGVAHSSAPASLSELRAAGSGGSQLVVLDPLLAPARREEGREWVVAVEALERGFFEPLWQALGSAWTRVEIVPCDGRRFRLSRADRYRLWRRPRPLATWARFEEGWDDG